MLLMFNKGSRMTTTVHVLRLHLSICECASFPFGFGGGMWGLIV